MADLQNSLEKRAEQWLKSDRAQQTINTKCVTWFNSKIQPDLAAETDPICQKFQISRSSLRFEDGIDPTLVDPDLSIADDILAATVTFVVNLVIAGGTIGSIIALVLIGHLIDKREAFDELIGKVGQELKKALDTKAEEAIILIQ